LRGVSAHFLAELYGVQGHPITAEAEALLKRDQKIRERAGK